MEIHPVSYGSHQVVGYGSNSVVVSGPSSYGNAFYQSIAPLQQVPTRQVVKNSDVYRFVPVEYITNASTQTVTRQQSAPGRSTVHNFLDLIRHFICF